jgi:hypothetical protein
VLELRCPACGLANGVRDAATLDRTRCAGCAGPLEEDRPVRYFVTADGDAQGPRAHRDLETAVAAGTLTPDTLLSEEDGPWFGAGEREDLFPPSRTAALSVSPRARRSGPRVPPPPGPVHTMAVLDVVVGVLILVVAFFVFALLSSLHALGRGLPVILVLVLLGIAHFRLATALRRRAVWARNVQLGLAGLGGVGLLLLLAEGMPPALGLLGAFLVALPFLLLLGAESQAWFEGREDGA